MDTKKDTQPTERGPILGILSIIFCFYPLLGLVLGLFAVIRGRRVLRSANRWGYKTDIVTGAVGASLSAVLLIFNSIGNYNDITNTADSAVIRNEASAVQKIVINYESTHAAYPDYEALTDILNDSAHSSMSLTPLDQDPLGDVVYEKCSDDGAYILYWNSSDENYLSLALGETSGCEYIESIYGTDQD